MYSDIRCQKGTSLVNVINSALQLDLKEERRRRGKRRSRKRRRRRRRRRRKRRRRRIERKYLDSIHSAVLKYSDLSENPNGPAFHHHFPEISRKQVALVKKKAVLKKKFLKHTHKNSTFFLHFFCLSFAKKMSMFSETQRKKLLMKNKCVC